MTRPRTFALLLALAVAGACELAHAQEPPRAPDASAPAYTLEVDSDAPDVISYDAIASRVASDLGGAVARAGTHAPSRAALTVRYRAADRSLVVRAAHAGGRVLERTVRAEGDPADVQREAILLASNLARDEARELLDALTARPAAPQPAPAPPSSSSAPAPAPAPQHAKPRTDGEVIASAALVFPVATNFAHPRVASGIDLSLGFGRVGGVHAVQLGAAVTYASVFMHGAQISGAAGMAGEMRGVQLAGAFAYASEDAHGAQIAGGLALARELRGLQLAPVNVASDVEGAQIGVVNIGRRVKGAQIGVVNVAEDVDGAAVGLVTVNRAGIHPIAWSSNLGYANVGIKFASKYVYTVVAAHWGTPETDLDPRFGSTAALGLHVPVVSSFDVEAEGAVSNIQPEGFSAHRSNSWVHARVLPGWTFAPHLRVFAGGGFRAPIDVDVGKSVFRPEFLGGVQF